VPFHHEIPWNEIKVVEWWSLMIGERFIYKKQKGPSHWQMQLKVRSFKGKL
jgi:hypothetical protein